MWTPTRTDNEVEKPKPLRKLDERTKALVHDIMLSVEVEVLRAMQHHEPMASAHEGYAVILEELDELWAEVCRKQAERSAHKMEDEARQIAAMGARFIFDVIYQGVKK